MKKATIYLRAARCINSQRQEFSCNAISGISSWPTYPERWLYINTMGRIHRGADYPTLSISDIEKASGAESGQPAARNFRVWLLCMMAAIVGDEKVGS